MVKYVIRYLPIFHHNTWFSLYLQIPMLHPQCWSSLIPRDGFLKSSTNKSGPFTTSRTFSPVKPGTWHLAVRSVRYLHHLFWISQKISTIRIFYLVGGLEHDFYDIPFTWECHHTKWLSLHHFQRDRSTTNQIIMKTIMNTIIITININHRLTID
jgi:hypothetical protein